LIAPAPATSSETFLDDRDIWRTAGVMIKRFGNDALIESAMRADELAADGDLDGGRVWRRICAAIKFLSEKTTIGPVH